jgi:hypothetical protein
LRRAEHTSELCFSSFSKVAEGLRQDGQQAQSSATGRRGTARGKEARDQEEQSKSQACERSRDCWTVRGRTSNGTCAHTLAQALTTDTTRSVMFAGKHSLLYPLLMHARTHARVSCSHSDPKQLYLELKELKEKEARCETQFARLPWIDKQSRSVAAGCWCSSPRTCEGRAFSFRPCT